MHQGTTGRYYAFPARSNRQPDGAGDPQSHFPYNPPTFLFLIKDQQVGPLFGSPGDSFGPSPVALGFEGGNRQRIARPLPLQPWSGKADFFVRR